MASSVDPELTERLRQCLAQVTGAQLGSGLFIAPRTVLTCAHVAGRPGDRVSVRWQGDRAEGSVRWASASAPSAQLAPSPDLAVIELSGPAVGAHPVALLDDHLPAASATIFVVGYAAGSDPRSGEVSGLYRSTGRYREMIRLIGDEVLPGMSGGPVLNADTGAVCGVMKATRQANQSMGGFAMPLRGLRTVVPLAPYRALWRAHDEYHRRNRLWTDASDRIAGERRGVGRRAERELRMILTGLPEPAGQWDRLTEPGSVVAMLVDTPVLDYGDVVTGLAELVEPEDGFPRLLAYAISLARDLTDLADDAGVSQRLRDWIQVTARRLDLVAAAESRLCAPRRGAGPQAGGRSLPSIMIRIRPVGNDRNRYRYMIWSCAEDSTIRTRTEEGRSAELDRVRQQLRKRLPELVRGNYRRVMVELIVPRGLMDENVDEWQARPSDAPWSTLGRRHPVVLRELERFEEDDAESWAWWERWNALDDQDLGGIVQVVSCMDIRDHEAMDAWLEQDSRRAALVLPGPPRQPPARTALEVGLRDGVPIMIWHRDGCEVGSGAPHLRCRGGRMALAVRAALSGTHRDDLPTRVMLLRNESIGGSGDPADEHCGKSIVLLWDHPGRRPPRQRMVPPTEGRFARV